MTQTVTLRIVGENGQLLGVIRASKAELDGLGKSATSAGAQAAQGARGVNQLGDASERTRRRATLLTGTLGNLRTMFTGLLGAAVLRDIGRTADGYTDIQGRLEQVTKSIRELHAANRETFAIAQETYQSWEATVALYQRGAQALEEYGVEQSKVAELTRTVNQGLLVSRAGAAESASAILQLSQALGAGALRGEEFNAVNEAAPRLMKALADSMGVPRGALKDLAAEGRITVNELLKAWTGPEAAKIAEEAAKVPLTMGRAWEQQRNLILKRIGEIDSAIGASGAIARNLGSTFSALAKGVAAFALLMAGRLVSALVASTRQFVAQQMATNAAYLATMRLNTGMGAVPATLARVATGVRSLGAGLLAFAGGPLGVVVIGLGVLISKFISARAEAKALREEVASALDGIDEAITSGNRRLMAREGERLLVLRAEQQDAIASLEKNIDDLRFNPIARTTGIYEQRQAELANFRHQLERTEVALARNRAAIMAGEAALGSSTATTNDAGAAVADFNKELEKQNEKLKLERIEREQGIRAALEYQAMQAAGVTSVGQLSQATRDLIDTQVQEVSAAQAYKEAQKEAERAASDAAKATDEQRRAQAEYADQLALARAELQGPLAVAQVEHDQAVRSINQAYADGNILIDTRNGLLDVERQKLEQTTATITAKRNILAQIVGDYTEQIRLSGLSAQAYRVEEELQRRVNDAREAGVEVTAELKAQWREAIAAGEDQLAIADAARRAAEEFEGTWLNAVQSVGRAFGDWVTGSISSLGDLRDVLKDIGKRWFSDVFSKGFEWLVNGGFAGAGRQQGAGGGGIGGWLSAMAGREGFLGGIARAFGFQPGAAATGMGWGNAAVSTLGGGAGFLAMPAGAGASPFTAAGAAQAMGGNGFGSLMQSGAMVGAQGGLAGAGKFFGKGGAGSYLAAIAGALYGFNSTDDGLGKGLAAGAYGAAGYGLSLAAGAGMTAYAGGAGLAASGTAAIGAIPVAGWIALAAIAIDKLSGGKLFGTKFKVESGENQFTYADGAFTGAQEITKVRQRSLFRGRKWTTEAGDIGDEARDALSQAHAAISDAVAQAAAQLGVTAPALLAATFKQEFDGKGNLKREFGEIAGRTYREAQDAFQQRYLAENLLAVAGMAGHADTIDELANRYRGTAEALTDFSTLMLAIAGDAKAGALLWEDTDEALTKAVATLEALRGAGESLAKTYERVVGGARQYGQLIAGVRGELLTRDLSDFARAQLDVELQYRAQVKSANELAKALGLSGARAEDLAAIEQLRAVRMADLQQQMERQRDEFLGNLRLSELGPGTDRSKLADAMGQLQAAVAAGDMQRAQQLSQTALGFGRNLYASGSDYNALYGQVTALLQQLDPADAGLTSDALQQLADTMETLPNDIAAALFGLLQGQTPTPPPPAPGRPGLPDRPRRNPKLDDPYLDLPGGQRGADLLTPLQRIADGTDELLRHAKRTGLVAGA